jgi:hypothetical protein
MAKEEKTDCLQNLSEVGTLLGNVAQKQVNRGSLSGNPANLNGGDED